MINRISKIASMALVLIMALTMAIGCKTVEPEEEAAVETSEEAPAETAEEEEVTEEEVEVEEEAEAEEPETVTIIDGFGREVTIKKPLKKVVVGHFVVSELMKLLGAENRVVGVDLRTTTDTMLYPGMSMLPVIQSADMHYDGINYEKIFELQPDIFLVAVSPLEPGFEDILAKLEPEIPVVALSVDDMESILDSVKILASILGEEKKAEEYFAFYDETMSPITNKIAEMQGEDKPQVYFEFLPYFTFNNDCPVYPTLVTLAGGVNIAADLPQMYGQVDPEWVITCNPDIIITQVMPYPIMGTPATACGYDADDPTEIEVYRNACLARDELAEIVAVKTEKVYGFYYGFAAGGKILVGIACLAKWFHPDLFADLDPKAIHQEYLTRFMRIDYDLEKHGVFVYPEP